MTSAIIFTLAFFVRIYNLIFPLEANETHFGLSSPENFDKFIGIPVSCFHGLIQPFFGYLVFFTKKIFPYPEYMVRIPSVIIGIATVMLIYKLAKEMYGEKAGLVSSLLLCFLPWHVVYSRLGLSLILAPFFGCLIFLALIKAIHKKSNLWFLVSWLFLGIGSLYTYNASLSFIPIFLVTLLFLRKELNWLRPRTFIGGITVLIILLYPLLHLQMSGKIDFLSNFYHDYHKNPFIGNIVLNLLQNFKNNCSTAFKSLFLSSYEKMYFAPSFRHPLLIHWITLPVILFTFLNFLRKRKTEDKIIFTWLGVGFLGGISFVNFFHSRYIIVILVPFLLLIARSFSIMLCPVTKTNFIRQRLLSYLGTSVLTWLVFIGIYQLADYYIIAPVDLEECRRNRYGCQETALFLNRMLHIENCRIIYDVDVTTGVYLKYYHGKDSKRWAAFSTTCAYYILWAPESHPKEYWDGTFWRGYHSFRQKYPEQTPIKTTYYPGGIPAINIFKVEEANCK